ncbi:MAG: cupin domain-containing protein [Thiomicrorhabdus chilensis]|uniref:cupin domain-containing protein n=1 Tax=Thiomicrorhabdus chilensis TaxID=63656 RepID=UPI00299EFCC6|nr:cupin domain-containing protein [Thiomicrorhabdus chilensis]MDX1348325.1 cupin domain-containing protein [Thiomicrorhabdus chilensis]
MQITIESHPAQSYLDTLAVKNWPIWEKEISEFPWFYEMEEVCFILQGEVIVTPEKGQPVRIKAGDLVTFPKGMHCRWHITQDIRKHYLFR